MTDTVEEHRGGELPTAEAKPTLPVSKRLMKAYIDVLARVSPAAAGRKATDLFAYTRAHAPPPEKDHTPLGARRFTVRGNPGVAHGYLWGRAGKTVLLVHGWGADSSCMYGFVRSLTRAGYQVAAFDAPGHGVSPGNTATMTQFKNAVKAVIESLDHVSAIVTHSLGGIPTIGALNELSGRQRVEAVCLLAPPCTLPEVIRRWSNDFLDLPAEVLKEMHNELLRRNGVPVAYWNVAMLGRPLKMPMLLLHDPLDDIVALAESEKIVAALPNSALERVPGAGHMRILSDAKVIDRVTSFIAETSIPELPRSDELRGGRGEAGGGLRK